MFKLMKKSMLVALLATGVITLTACSSSGTATKVHSGKTSKIFANKSGYKGSLADPIVAMSSLSEQHHEWKGTRYRLGGTNKRGIDCSGFTQLTFRELFGIDIPRTTTEQANAGVKIAKSELRTGDLVFFKTGRGPNGKHVGIYVKDGQFLHASTRAGVTYSDLNSPYWSKTYWQARRL